MEETKVKVTIEVDGKEEKVMEGTGAVVMMYTKTAEGMSVDECARNVNPLMVAVHLSAAREQEMKPGTSIMHDVMNAIREADKKSNSIWAKIRRFFTNP